MFACILSVYTVCTLFVNRHTAGYKAGLEGGAHTVLPVLWNGTSGCTLLSLPVCAQAVG